jgi:hypothetical protein
MMTAMPVKNCLRQQRIASQMPFWHSAEGISGNVEEIM